MAACGVARAPRMRTAPWLASTEEVPVVGLKTPSVIGPAR
jgi:hypothetical protein